MNTNTKKQTKKSATIVSYEEANDDFTLFADC